MKSKDIFEMSDDEFEEFKENASLGPEFWKDFENQQKEELNKLEFKVQDYSIKTFNPQRHHINHILKIYAEVVMGDDNTCLRNIEKNYLIPLINSSNIINVVVGSKKRPKENVIGILWYNYSSPIMRIPEDKTIFINGLVVDEDYRGYGIGHHLIWRTIAENQERIHVFKKIRFPIEKVILFRPHDLEETVQFYKKIGFLHSEEFKKDTYGRYPTNRFDKDYRMMVLPLKREVFVDHLIKSGIIPKAELNDFIKLSNEEMILRYFTMECKRGSRYSERDIHLYQNKKIKYRNLFDHINDFLKPLIVRLPDGVIQNEPLFKPYLT